MPATQPRPEQIQALSEHRPEGPLYMLNLLKFKEKASYGDERETDLTGAEAYGIYGAGVAKILSEIGGHIEFGFQTNVLVIGDGELEWDSVALVRYPSFEAFVKMTQSDAYQAIHVHREAGLAHQLLINCLSPDQATTAIGLG
jgi:uncharacterized protein (DUF1330 family)